MATKRRKETYTRWDPADNLKSEADIRAYLIASFEEAPDDAAYIAAALGDVARARGMTEPRKPIFGFLWPKPDPDAPVDSAYHQERRVRVANRGPVRLAVLLVGTATVSVAAGASILAGLASGPSVLTIVVAAALACALVALLRGWIVGTYVTDDAVTVETVLRRFSCAWTEVREIVVDEVPCPYLGLPLRSAASRSFLVLRGGTRIATHVYATSLDLWLRPEAFDIAVLRLQRWLPER